MEKAHYHYVISPILEMRKAPSSTSEVVSQASFSEEIILHRQEGLWVKIETLCDGYQGWVKKKGVHSRLTPFYPSDTSKLLITNRLRAHVYANQDTIYGPLLTLPFDSYLVLNDEKKREEEKWERSDRWLSVLLPDGKKAEIQRGDVVFERPLLSSLEACRLSHNFLGLPYTWGGRSSFGYDCSGFVQMLYRMMGIFLPRDSQEQCDWIGFHDVKINQLQPTDLIFFGLSREKIKHVGMFLGESKFIHTSAAVENMPYLRMSTIQDSAWNGSGHYPFICGRSIQKMYKDEK